MTATCERVLSDIMPRLPEIQELLCEPEEDELFVCTNGFEDRSNVIAARLAEAGYRAKQTVVLRYTANAEDCRVLWPDLNRALQIISKKPPIDVQVDEVDVARELNAICQSVGGGSTARVTADFSVMANRVVLAVMATLMKGCASARVAYAESAKYFPSKVEYEAHRAKRRRESKGMLDEGVARVVVNPLY